MRYPTISVSGDNAPAVSTNPDHRGHGISMDLLRHNLDKIDEQRMPAYLESSKPRNDQRYQGIGIPPVLTFRLPDAGPTVTGRWRPAGGREPGARSV